MCAPVFIAKTWKQPKCPSTDNWLKETWHIYNGILLSHIKKNEILPFAATWMDLESIMLSEISQTKTNTVHRLHVESKKYNKLMNRTEEQIHRYRDQISGYHGVGWGMDSTGVREGDTN